MAETSQLPVPRGAFLAAGNYLALALLVGNIEVAAFDQALNPLINVAYGDLRTALEQIKLLTKKAL